MLFPDGHLLLVLPDCGLVRQRDVISRAHIGEERLQAVVIRLKNRVVFVVVAARAAESQAGEDGAYGVSDIVQDLLTSL